MIAIFRPVDIAETRGFKLKGPARFVFRNPLRGGPPLADLRDAFRGDVRAQFSGTFRRIFIDVFPGVELREPHTRLAIASGGDPIELERSILGLLPEFDAVEVIGDERVAKAFGDRETGTPVVMAQAGSRSRVTEGPDFSVIMDKGDLAGMVRLALYQINLGAIGMATNVVSQFRSLAEPFGPFAGQRCMLAAELAEAYYLIADAEQATIWATRSLLDAPNVSALVLLGNLAEDRGNLYHARAWYEAACVMPHAPGDEVAMMILQRRRNYLRMIAS